MLTAVGPKAPVDTAGHDSPHQLVLRARSVEKRSEMCSRMMSDVGSHQSEAHGAGGSRPGIVEMDCLVL